MGEPGTPGQTVGPFFGYALPYAGGESLVPKDHEHAVRLHGTVLDGAGQPIPDALLEIWQSDQNGEAVHRPGSLHRDGYTFTGWGRTATDNIGHYSFTTLLPARHEPGRAAFIAMTVFARGLLDRLFTRVYLPDPAAVASDPFLLSLPPDRRATLLARREDDGSLGFDVRLQGEFETVFLTFGG
jgi:protocatechuate 3,4-dioxygenase alpha subunit